MLAGCWPFSSSSPQSAPTPPGSSTAASSTAASPTAGAALGGDFCSVVIKVNTDAGTMVNKKYIPVDQTTQAQIMTLTDWTIAHRAEFLAITPAELKADVELEMQWWQAIKDAGYDWKAAKVPDGFGPAAKRISDYEHSVCGIS